MNLRTATYGVASLLFEQPHIVWCTPIAVLGDTVSFSLLVLGKQVFRGPLPVQPAVSIALPDGDHWTELVDQGGGGGGGADRHWFWHRQFAAPTPDVDQLRLQVSFQGQEARRIMRRITD